MDLLDSSGVVLASRNIQGFSTFWELDVGSVSGVTTVKVSMPTYSSFVLPKIEVLGSSGDSLLTGSYNHRIFLVHNHDD